MKTCNLTPQTLKLVKKTTETLFQYLAKNVVFSNRDYEKDSRWIFYFFPVLGSLDIKEKVGISQMSWTFFVSS